MDHSTAVIKPWHWLLWHPHQGLWNHDLLRLLKKAFPRFHKRLEVLVINLDTTLLFMSALATRIRTVGLVRAFGSSPIPSDLRVVYLDLGTHEQGAELSWVIESVLPDISPNFLAYGFEASPESFECVKDKFKNRPEVQIVHGALCYEVPPGGTVRLYRDGRRGEGNSIYRRTNDFDEVAAMRLSDFMQKNIPTEGHFIFIMRMNIEGAEYDVLRDLAETGLSKRIDGYFGMWDDVSKIDLNRDREFRRFISANGIRTFPFNGRDLRWPFRKYCIAYQMRTRIMAAAKRMAAQG